eukprot:250502-Chlamydomonas_euryale.AAC.11
MFLLVILPGEDRRLCQSGAECMAERIACSCVESCCALPHPWAGCPGALPGVAQLLSSPVQPCGPTDVSPPKRMTSLASRDLT